jgi:hypothetical protein
MTQQKKNEPTSDRTSCCGANAAECPCGDRCDCPRPCQCGAGCACATKK